MTGPGGVPPVRRQVEEFQGTHLQVLVLQARVIRPEKKVAGTRGLRRLGRPGNGSEARVVPGWHAVQVPSRKDEDPTLAFLWDVWFHFQFFPFQEVRESAEFVKQSLQVWRSGVPEPWDHFNNNESRPYVAKHGHQGPK
jgi:hypothetical protein